MKTRTPHCWLSVAVVLLLLGCIVCACAPTPRDRQLAAAKHLTPSQRYSSTSRAAEEIAKPEDVKRMTVRVYASDDYRAETVRWRKRIRRQIEAASQVTREQFGFELALVQIVKWQPQADGSDMREVLAELVRRDPADDVDYVFGMTTSLAVFEPSLHLLGMAEIFGQHIVLRAMNDSAEREQINEAFDELTDEERGNLYVSRLRHKETSVLLHELGHALGAVHTREPHWLMSPMSRSSQRAFGPANTRIVRTAIKLRGEHATHDAWRKAFVEVLAEELDGEFRSDFEPEARAYVKELAAAYLDPNVLSRREAKRVNHARELTLQGRHEKAWAHLEPLAAARGDNPNVAGLACYLRARLQPGAQDTLERCREAYDVAAEDPTAALFLAHIHLDKGERAEAIAMTKEASRRMNAHGKVQAHQWISLATLQVQIGSFTLAEQSLSHAPMMVGAKSVREDIEDQRRYYGLRKGAVTADAEADYLTIVQNIEQKIAAENYKAAKKLLAELQSSHGGVAATQALTCQAHVMSRDLKSAEKACARALELDGDCVLAHIMSGYVALDGQDTERAGRHFEKARDLLPRHKDVWNALARFYKNSRKASALESLKAQYEERFDEPLVVR